MTGSRWNRPVREFADWPRGCHVRLLLIYSPPGTPRTLRKGGTISHFSFFHPFVQFSLQKRDIIGPGPIGIGVFEHLLLKFGDF